MTDVEAFAGLSGVVLACYAIVRAWRFALELIGF